MSELLEIKPANFFESVIDEVKAPYDLYKSIKIDLEYLKIIDTDSESIIDQKMNDAKAKAKQYSKFRIEIKKIAKAKRDGFNKTSKEIIAIEKQFTEEIIATEKFLKDQVEYRSIRAEKVAQELHEARLIEIQPYVGFYQEIAFGYATNEAWEQILQSAKLLHGNHIKQEEAEIVRKKQEAEDQARLREENSKLKEDQEIQKRKIAELEANSPKAIIPEPEKAIKSTRSDSALQDLIGGIDNLIVGATAPVNKKELIVFNNALDLLRKTKTFVEFNL